MNIKAKQCINDNRKTSQTKKYLLKIYIRMYTYSQQTYNQVKGVHTNMCTCMYIFVYVFVLYELGLNIQFACGCRLGGTWKFSIFFFAFFSLFLGFFFYISDKMKKKKTTAHNEIEHM